MSVAAQTSDEVRIAERYLSVLADISRCAEAVRHGDWRDLADTADDLCRRAALLAESASKLEHAEPGPRGDVVATLVASVPTPRRPPGCSTRPGWPPSPRPR